MERMRQTAPVGAVGRIIDAGRDGKAEILVWNLDGVEWYGRNFQNSRLHSPRLWSPRDNRPLAGVPFRAR